MLADLHSHYPMHLLEEWASGRDVGPARTIERMRRLRRPNKFRALLLGLLSRRINRRTPTSPPRVTVDGMVKGDARLVFSVLYSPFAEIDLDRPFQDDPVDEYFAHLKNQIGLVEQDLRLPANRQRARVVRTGGELDAARNARAVAVVHCVEGGFHLGARHSSIEANVATLADAGVAYITIAHLFYRGFATNVNAIPFIWDWLYKLLFPQPRREGLSERGEVAIRAMAEHGILVDLAHMTEESLEETFEILDEVAPTMPVVASHAGYRFGRQDYMLDARTLERIAERGGLVGLIMAQHQMNDGVRRRHTRTVGESLAVIYRHIDRIRDITGSYDHIGLGSDLDGFIKPTMSGIEEVQDLKSLRNPLVERYGADTADKILYGNAERVLRALWAWKETPVEQRGVPAPD